MNIMKVFKVILVIAFIVSMVLSASAQGNASESDSDVVVSGETISDPVDGSLLDANVIGGVVIVILSLTLLIILYVLLEAVKLLGISIPPDTVQQWTSSFKELTDSSMDRLREQAPKTVSPVDDIFLAGAEYTLPKILKYLESLSLNDDEFQSLKDAALSPVVVDGSQNAVQLE